MTGEWISVKDRQPERDGWYIVYDKKWGEIHITRYWTEEGTLGWAGTEITHWMPLPEPPEEG